MTAQYIPQDLNALGRGDSASPAARFAREFWKEYAPKLERAGRLTDLDYAAFEMLCFSYGALRACELQIAAEGETILTYQERGDHERVVKHPASAARNEHRRSFIDLADRFGLSPKARGLLKKPDDPAPVAKVAPSMLDQ